MLHGRGTGGALPRRPAGSKVRATGASHIEVGPTGGAGWAGPGKGAVLLRWLSTMTSFTGSFPYHSVCSSNTNHCWLYVMLVFVCVLSVPRIMSIKADTLPFSDLGPEGSQHAGGTCSADPY